ncbi:MAG: DUF177 domain-containing protein [Clostridia bacterium]|nr:DUF177 domain-containing protein [Clostridia bacterium]
MRIITRGCGTLRLDIQQLLANDGGTLCFEFSLPVGGVSPDVVEGTASVKGKVVNHGGYLLLSADTHITASVLCGRCGEVFGEVIGFSTERPVARKLSDGDNDEYLVADEDGFLDLDSFFEEELLLELPTKFLCSEACKGLCPKCGVNLNSGGCSCSHKEVDPRLAVLKALLENG